MSRMPINTKLASIAAILGIITVLLNTFTGSRNLHVYIAGFLLMFLGTLWRAVLEMNSED